MVLKQKVTFSQIYPTELQLVKANSFETEALFLNRHGRVSSKIYNKQVVIYFESVDFPFLVWDIPGAIGESPAQSKNRIKPRV